MLLIVSVINNTIFKSILCHCLPLAILLHQRAGASLSMLPDDISMYVEVGEQNEHHNHVASQKILAPAWKVTLNFQRIQSMRQRYAKLNLLIIITRNLTYQMSEFKISLRTKLLYRSTACHSLATISKRSCELLKGCYRSALIHA